MSRSGSHPPMVLGVDIGTSSSKAVLVDVDGAIVATAERAHAVERPRPGHVEMDARIWWDEFVGLTGELLAWASDPRDVVAVGVSGMGPCVLVTGTDGEPLRPAILYGIDTRAGAEIAELTERLTTEAIVSRSGSALSSQAVGPKLAWLAANEPDVFALARRLLMPSSFLVARLTGEYVLDHHSASQSDPLYDLAATAWHEPWWREIAAPLVPPPLRWPGEAAGAVSASAAAATGLRARIPVTVGTIDAWSEALSVGADTPGALMLMYGTTMFLIATGDEPLAAPPLWATVGIRPGSHCLAGGMATSGAITAWLRDLTGGDFAELTAAADRSGQGAGGLVMVPYFAGERTPVADPDARGVIAGLTLSHTAGDLYRAALEATAFGVRHHLEAFRSAGARIDRVVAVGGGAQSALWPQIVSDVTGLRQEVRAKTIGASLGAAFLAAGLVGNPAIDRWNPVVGEITPGDGLVYDELYPHYRALYESTGEVAHALASFQHRQHASSPQQRSSAP